MGKEDRNSKIKSPKTVKKQAEEEKAFFKNKRFNKINKTGHPHPLPPGAATEGEKEGKKEKKTHTHTQPHTRTHTHKHKKIKSFNKNYALKN